MKNKKVLYVVAAILVVLVCVILTIGKNNSPKNGQAGQSTNNEASDATTPLSAADNTNQSETMVDCGSASDPSCFMNRMNGCLPVTIQMTGNDQTTKIELTILGIENDTCHFQRKINNTTDLNCYFPKGTMNWDTIDQTFGNDRGLQKVVDSACKKG